MSRKRLRRSLWSGLHCGPFVHVLSLRGNLRLRRSLWSGLHCGTIIRPDPLGWHWLRRSLWSGLHCGNWLLLLLLLMLVLLRRSLWSGLHCGHFLRLPRKLRTWTNFAAPYGAASIAANLRFRLFSRNGRALRRSLWSGLHCGWLHAVASIP